MEEEWKPIPGYEGWYEASSLGRIRGVDRVVIMKNGHERPLTGKIRTLSKAKRGGYLSVCLRKEGTRKTYTVHRLIMRTFIGEPPEGKNEVDHIDGNRENNRLDNLEYVSKQENYMRMVKNQGRAALIFRLEELEQRIGELERKLEERENG